MWNLGGGGGERGEKDAVHQEKPFFYIEGGTRSFLHFFQFFQFCG